MPTKALLTGKVLTTLVMLLIFTTMTLLALDFTPKARLMPLLVGIPAVLLALVQLIMDYRSAVADLSKPAAEGTIAAPADKKVHTGSQGETQMFIWIFLFFLGILLFGFVYASPVLVFSFLYFGSKESMKISLVSAIATGAVIYITFIKSFQIALFNGLILNWLLG